MRLRVHRPAANAVAIRRGGVFCLILACSLPAWAEPRLTYPLDCDPHDACYVQRLVDHDPGPGLLDGLCGDLTGDGHKGTDFALPSLAAMREGVAVLAVAPGRVSALRDGMADSAAEGSGAFEGRECGNGVLTDLGDGWEAQYCHLAEGSIAVERGADVSRGQVLGRVGLSGATTFPHLHLSLRRDGQVIDPFAADGPACETTPRSLFDTPPPIPPGGFVTTGFAPDMPTLETIEDGTAAVGAVEQDAGALVLWTYLFAGKSGDTVAFRIDGPDGRILDEVTTLDRAQPQLFRAMGRKRPTEGWTPGSYRGAVTLSRDGETLDRQEIRVTVD